MTENEKLKYLDDLFLKDSIEKSKQDFTIYFDDSLKGFEKDFKNQLYEENIGFDEFHLREISNDLTKSKKIDLTKIEFPKNIKLTKKSRKEFSKWKEDFLGRYWFSRIMFNKEKNKAVVEFNQICGNLCGSGTIIYLLKTDGKWKVKHYFGSWVS